MKIYIIRHAEPDYENNTLTKKGFIEAEALGKYYQNTKFDEIYVSPLNRARYTAASILKYQEGLKPVIKPWLKEFYHPIIHEETNEEIQNWDLMPKYFSSHEEMYDDNKYLETDLMKSGNIKKYYDEVSSNLDAILLANGYKRNGRVYEVISPNERKIVFICHLCTMSVLMSHLLGIPYLLISQNFACLTSGVTIINTEEREKGTASFRLERFSDISHLVKYNIAPSSMGKFKETY